MKHPYWHRTQHGHWHVNTCNVPDTETDTGHDKGLECPCFIVRHTRLKQSLLLHVGGHSTNLTEHWRRLWETTKPKHQTLQCWLANSSRIEKLYGKMVEARNYKSSTVNEQLLKQKGKEGALPTSSKVARHPPHWNSSICNWRNSLATTRSSVVVVKTMNKVDPSVKTLASMIQQQEVTLEAQKMIINEL